MDKNKQIVDMTLDIMNEASFSLELSGVMAESLYDKGWRKASNVADDLWKTRTYLVELYHKYRNKADKHSLTEEEKMFYQGRAEAIWEVVHELDKLREEYMEEK